jgi:prepilin-type N-terminal cleavage/methylation domain-containing protein
MRRGFTLLELLIVIAIILVIITVSLPPLEKGRMLAREMAASKAVQTIQTVEVMYQAEYGHYATTLRELGPPESGPSSAAAAGLMSHTLASGAVGAYRFKLAGDSETFAITAEPAVCAVSGRKSFYMDQAGFLRATDCPNTPSASSPEFAQ